MNLIKSQLALLCVGTFFLGLVVGELPPLKKGPRGTIFETDIDGIHVSVPYLNPNYEDYPDVRRALDVDIMNRFRDMYVNFSTQALVEEKSYKNLMKLSIKFKNLFQSEGEKMTIFSGLGYGPPIGQDYVENTVDMFMQILGTQSDEPVEKSGLAERKLVIQRMRDFLTFINKVVAESPHGMFLKWKDLRMGDKTLIEEAGYFVKFFKKNGYGTEMSMFIPIVKGLASLKYGRQSQI